MSMVIKDIVKDKITKIALELFEKDFLLSHNARKVFEKEIGEEKFSLLYYTIRTLIREERVPDNPLLLDESVTNSRHIANEYVEKAVDIVSAAFNSLIDQKLLQWR